MVLYPMLYTFYIYIIILHFYYNILYVILYYIIILDYIEYSLFYFIILYHTILYYIILYYIFIFNSVYIYIIHYILYIIYIFTYIYIYIHVLFSCLRSYTRSDCCLHHNGSCLHWNNIASGTRTNLQTSRIINAVSPKQTRCPPRVMFVGLYTQ